MYSRELLVILSKDTVQLIECFLGLDQKIIKLFDPLCRPCVSGDNTEDYVLYDWAALKPLNPSASATTISKQGIVIAMSIAKSHNSGTTMLGQAKETKAWAKHKFKREIKNHLKSVKSENITLP